MLVPPEVTAVAARLRRELYARDASTRPCTPRELEILGLMAMGCTRKQIAQRLGISPESVKTRAEQAYRRLGARNATHAVALLIRAGKL